MMKNLWTAIGDFFTATFEVMPLIGNKINYLYILIIFFLVTWTVIMFKHKRNGEEHRSS